MNEALPNTQVSSSRPVVALVWTVFGVATLWLLGKAIALAGSGMPYGCWQLTGARAAAATLIVGSMMTLRRGNLALFGVLYGLTLIASHGSASLLASAALAGGGAWVAARSLCARPTLALLAGTLAFNILLTASGFVLALHGNAGSRTGLHNWGTGVCLRALATVAVVGAIVLVARLIEGRETVSSGRSLSD